DGLLADASWAPRSEPACRAVLAAQALAPAAGLEFAAGLGAALYGRGLAPDEPATLRQVALEADLDPGALLRRWSSDAARAETQRSFAEAQARGVTRYPSLYVETRRGLTPICRGWTAPGELLARVEAEVGAPRGRGCA
ncbi:MAG: DsbA family protein, partial [Myxococcales bacterium]